MVNIRRTKMSSLQECPVDVLRERPTPTQLNVTWDIYDTGTIENRGEWIY